MAECVGQRQFLHVEIPRPFGADEGFLQGHYREGWPEFTPLRCGKCRPTLVICDLAYMSSFETMVSCVSNLVSLNIFFNQKNWDIVIVL